MPSTKIDSKELRLRIVDAGSVVLHEQTDPQRVERLRIALMDTGTLRNPPIVAEAGANTYVVLDGATRTTALKELGCRDTLVQIVDYSQDVTLEAWYHVLSQSASDAAEKFVRTTPEILAVTCTQTEAQALLNNRDCFAALVYNEQHTLALKSTTSAYQHSRGLIASYGGYGEIHRIVHDELIESVQSNSLNSVVVMYPAYKPEEIINLALAGDRLPAGITRHLIPGRALNVGVHLQLLEAAGTIAEKNEWLKGWLLQKILTKKARYYHEPVFLFDD